MQINQTYIAAHLPIRVRIHPLEVVSSHPPTFIKRTPKKQLPALESQACLALLPFCGVHSTLLLSFFNKCILLPLPFCVLFNSLSDTLRPETQNSAYGIFSSGTLLNNTDYSTV